MLLDSFQFLATRFQMVRIASFSISLIIRYLAAQVALTGCAGTNNSTQSTNMKEMTYIESLEQQIDDMNMLNGISKMAEDQSAKYLTVAWRILNSTNAGCELSQHEVENVKYLIENSVLNFKEREKQFPIDLSNEIGLNLYS
jgi:hypothetical protein